MQFRLCEQIKQLQAEIERLTGEVATLTNTDRINLKVIQDQQTENERLQAHAKSMVDAMRADNEHLRAMHNTMVTQIEQLRSALEPFARNVHAESLLEALGHIEREHLLEAHRALDVHDV